MLVGAVALSSAVGTLLAALPGSGLAAEQFGASTQIAQLGGPLVAALLALIGLHGSKEQREQLVD